jgi:predicted ATPase
MIKRSRTPPAPLTLAELARAGEMQIMSGSPHWPTITDWQRNGLASLRWQDSGAFAFVVLTDKGRARVEARNPDVLAK